MSGPAAVADQAERDRLVSELERTFFVEAGAGTGKTAAVVSAIVARVAAGRLAMERLVAITFTIAAAGELRVRIREELEAAAAGPRRRRSDSGWRRPRRRWIAPASRLSTPSARRCSGCIRWRPGCLRTSRPWPTWPVSSTSGSDSAAGSTP